MKIKEILIEQKEKEVRLRGWVNSNRGNDKIRFIALNDGSDFDDIQIVFKNEYAKKLNSIKMGSSLEVEGNILLTPDAKQPLEVIATDLKILSEVDEDFPLQKQGMSMEVLREIPHVRHRTKTFRAVMRIRSTLALLIHDFFNEQNFLYHASPIITSNDGEGAGESFVVDSEEKGFFNTKATLGVTGQLHAEAYANGFGDVYTFAPTFRAENSHTQRHVAEFWMVEPELAFASKKEIVALADKMLKYVISNVMKRHSKEFVFLNQHIDDQLTKRLETFLKTDLKTITYRDAIKILQKNKELFKVKEIKFGIDLATEHERFLAEKVYMGPVAIVDFPKTIKAFYMKQNKDNETVGAFDLLVPGVGEMIGGSERETNINILSDRMKEMKIDKSALQWYLDLRRFGMYKSAGFGMGFERLVMYVTGIANIRDVIAFPRTPGNLTM